MNPIFREGHGNGIGHSITEFHERFNELCLEHLEAGRAKTFALIFYNFRDTELQQILEDRGAFAKLDRLSGRQLSVFYLDSETKEVTEYFNSHFLNKLGIAGEVSLPCVVFFKMRADQMTGIMLKRLNSANTMHGLHELYTTLEDYIGTEIKSA